MTHYQSINGLEDPVDGMPSDDFTGEVSESRKRTVGFVAPVLAS